MAQRLGGDLTPEIDRHQDGGRLPSWSETYWISALVIVAPLLDLTKGFWSERGTGIGRTPARVLGSQLTMDAHRLAEERSIAYHRAIAVRLGREPYVLETARRRVEGWLASAGDPPPLYARKWAEVLAGDPSSVATFLIERSELADELRQSSPFAGALSPRERWAIWRETRERLASRP